MNAQSETYTSPDPNYKIEYVSHFKKLGNFKAKIGISCIS